MENMILVVMIVCIVSGSVWYLHKAKKRGETCIGCPYAKQCKKKRSSACRKNYLNLYTI